MRREIVLLGDPLLRRKCKTVRTVDAATRRLIDDMLETMHEASGLGLAAPQVGVNKRILVAHDGECDPLVLVNPQIKSQRGKDRGVEGCLSIPGVQGNVSRARDVVVTGLDRAGRTTTIAADELLARVLQHEVDHLNGILILDRTAEVWWLAAATSQADGDDDEEQRLQRLPATVEEIEEEFARRRAETAAAAE